MRAEVTIEEDEETGRLEAILRIGANWEDVNVIHGDDDSELEALASLRNSIWAFRDGLRAAANLHGGLEDPRNKEARALYLRCFTTVTDLEERMRELRGKQELEEKKNAARRSRAWREERAMEAGMAHGIGAYNEVMGYDSYSPEPCGQHCYDCPRCGY